MTFHMVMQEGKLQSLLLSCKTMRWVGSQSVGTGIIDSNETNQIYEAFNCIHNNYWYHWHKRVNSSYFTRVKIDPVIWRGRSGHRRCLHSRAHLEGRLLVVVGPAIFCGSRSTPDFARVGKFHNKKHSYRLFVVVLYTWSDSYQVVSPSVAHVTPY